MTGIDPLVARLPVLSLGRLLVPGELWLPIAGLIAAWVAVLLAIRGDTERFDRLEKWLILGTAVAVTIARVTYVAYHWQDYAPEFWTIFDLRDGGFNGPSGAIAGAVTFSFGARRKEDARVLVITLCCLFMSAGVFAMLAVATGADAKNQLPALRYEFLDGTHKALPRDRPMVVNLWATWCSVCRREMPALLVAARRYPDVSIVYLNQGELNADVKGFSESVGLPVGSVALDPRSRLGSTLGVRVYPTTLFVSTDGRIVGSHVGELSKGRLQVMIHELQLSQ